MKNYRKLFLSIIIFINCFVIRSYGYPDKTSDFYINDFAGVLSQETKDYILSNSRALDESTGAQVVVTTLISLEGKTDSEAALEIGRQWGIGQEDKNNGLLILLAPNERKIRVEVGYGLEGALNDSKVGRFLDDYAVNYFKNDNWDEGIKNIYSVLIKTIYEEYNLEVPDDVKKLISSNNSRIKTEQNIIFYISIIILVMGIVYYIWNVNNKNKFHGGGSGSFFSGGSFFGTNDHPNGGGFSGGGGSFGGGGASRSF